jgi:hypothetical protein
MKKFLWVIVLALLSFFMIMGIAQAGQCIYLGRDAVGMNCYYDASDVKYSGDIVNFVFYYDDACKGDKYNSVSEINCARRMMRDEFSDGKWEPFDEGSVLDVAWQKLCR